MRYGLRSILRTPVKTLLFFLLIGAAAAFLCLGAGMKQSADAVLRQADGAFLTAGQLTYLGGNYPELAVDDPVMANQLENFQLGEIPGFGGQEGELPVRSVLLAEENKTMRAYVPGLEPNAPAYPNEAVLIFQIPEGYAENPEDWRIQCMVLETLYSKKECAGQLAFLYLRDEVGDRVKFQAGHRYLAHVNYEDGVSGYTNFSIAGFSSLGVRAGRPCGKDVPPLVDLDALEDGAAFWESETGRYYRNTAEMYRVLNNSLNLTATRNLDAVDAFLRGEYVLTKGRDFSAVDYTEGGVCIVSENTAKRLGLSVGDRLELAVHFPTEAGVSVLDSYWPETGFAEETSLEIIGLYQGGGTTRDDVFVPDSGQTWAAHSGGDYVLGRVVLENCGAEDYRREVAPLLPANVLLSVYDQGYASATAAVSGVQDTARLLLAAAGICALAVLVLFGYLFVGRSRESVDILLTLGAGRGRARRYLLSGCAAVALLAAAVGAAGGYLASGRAAEAAYAQAEENAAYDRRFSASGYGIHEEDFRVEFRISPLVPLAVGTGVSAGGILACALFAEGILRARDPRRRLRKARRRKKQAVPHSRGGQGADYLPGVSVRYTARSIRRGGGRSFVPAAAFLTLTVFVCLFSGTMGGYREQMDTVYDRIPVTLRFSDYAGKSLGNLRIPHSLVQKVVDTGFASWEDTHVSVGGYYFLGGVVSYADGRVSEEPFVIDHIPAGTFANESYLYWLKTTAPPLRFTDDPAYAPEFFYADPPEIQWLDGYSLEAMRSFPYNLNITDPKKPLDFAAMPEGICLAPESFLELHGLALGDTVLANGYAVLRMGRYDSLWALPYRVRIIGSFKGEDGKNTLYLPLSMLPSVQEEEVYHSVSCMLQNTRELGRFKDELAALGFSEINEVQGNRHWVIIDDTSLNDAVTSLRQHIAYLSLLYPVVLVLAVGMGFVVAYLLTRGRKEELAIMRSMGASPRRIFFGFFLEQALLCLPGGAAGLAAAWFLRGGLSGFQLWNAMGFALCYLAGTALAVWVMNRRPVLAILTDKENG